MLKNKKLMKITLDEIKKEYKIYEHTEAVKLIEKLIKEDVIAPIKSSELTPNYPQIHKRYRIVKKLDKVDEELVFEINNLYYKLSNDYYKKHIDKYKKDRKYIQKLNYYLINSKEKLDTILSVNERSFEIFSEEKFLMSKEGREIIKNLGLDLISFFRVYLTPEPFCYISLDKKIGQKILIIENKDTYITLMKLFNKGHNHILGTDISTLIYGEGYKIVSSFDYIHEDITINHLEAIENEILYWGDIDKAGLNIYELFKSKYSNLNIRLFTNAYSKMIELSKGLDLNQPKEQKEFDTSILLELDENLRQDIESLLDNDRYIPQEIININYLLKSER